MAGNIKELLPLVVDFDGIQQRGAPDDKKIKNSHS
jgi:hypothetical protein